LDERAKRSVPIAHNDVPREMEGLRGHAVIAFALELLAAHVPSV
jgi:hypothetical protein